MNATTIKTLLLACKQAGLSSTLCVDRDLDIGAMIWDKDPSELWACPPNAFKLVILSVPRPARELFRVLVLAERLLVQDGLIYILPFANDFGKETRIEATEIFCGAYPEWERRLIDGFIVELKRKPKEVFRNDSPIVIEDRADTWRVAELNIPSPPPGTFLSKEAILAIENIKMKDCKKVVSLSIFNDYRDLGEHWKQMPDMIRAWVRAHHTLFPGYELRIHHDHYLYYSNGGDLLQGYARRGLVNLVYVPSRPGQGKTERMLHRLLPLWSDDVDAVFCRDLDSIPTWRDRVACEEFLFSNCIAGVIHDNVNHIKVLGGLCHFRAKEFRQTIGEGMTFGDFIAAAGFTDEQWSVHGADQLHINQIVEKMSNILEHQLFVVQGENGERVIRKASWPQSTVRTELTMEIEDMVPSLVRKNSNSFINYMGAAGSRWNEAILFYNMFCPKSILEVENELKS